MFFYRFQTRNILMKACYLTIVMSISNIKLKNLCTNTFQRRNILVKHESLKECWTILECQSISKSLRLKTIKISMFSYVVDMKIQTKYWHIVYNHTKLEYRWKFDRSFTNLINSLCQYLAFSKSFKSYEDYFK